MQTVVETDLSTITMILAKFEVVLLLQGRACRKSVHTLVHREGKKRALNEKREGVAASPGQEARDRARPPHGRPLAAFPVAAWQIQGAIRLQTKRPG